MDKIAKFRQKGQKSEQIPDFAAKKTPKKHQENTKNLVRSEYQTKRKTPKFLVKSRFSGVLVFCEQLKIMRKMRI